MMHGACCHMAQARTGWKAYALVCLLLWLGFGQAIKAAPLDTLAREGWVVMPAGGKPAYMGIHGGTMPVSLLVYEGRSLITFVGRTGNDFLDVLRRTDVPMPSLLNATVRSQGQLELGGLVRRGGNAMPVFHLAGGPPLADAGGQLQPFGFSEKPLSIEGRVHMPQRPSPAKHYRLLPAPQYLQPR